MIKNNAFLWVSALTDQSRKSLPIFLRFLFEKLKYYVYTLEIIIDQISQTDLLVPHVQN